MAIGPHKALQELYLYSNGITSDGGIAIAKALWNKSELKMIGLSNNKIGFWGAEALGESLADK